ncbi:hypothetical protein DY000_02059870 [Brassica cretica]|uniref:Uncharacterized protein n=1 Tax=Brassica cretica TaxID=69181 RepID=A0ABQ7B262_BRACR|nr:hypothetical protein DY000_02059870 [Brassica cretica]
MVNLQRQRKKTEEKHELEEEIGGSENVWIPNYLMKEFVSFVGELVSAVKSAGELARAVKSAGELVSVVGFDHRGIRNQYGELSDLELGEKERDNIAQKQERGERSETFSLVSPPPTVNPKPPLHLLRSQAADGTSHRRSPSPVDRYSFVIAFHPLLSFPLPLLFAHEARRVGDGSGCIYSSSPTALGSGSDLRSEIRQKLRSVAAVHASAPPSRPSWSILSVSSRVCVELLLSLSERVLRTTLDVDVSRGKSDAFFRLQVTCFKEFCAPSVLHFPFKSSWSIAICNPAVSAASSMSRSGMRGQND